MEQFFYPSKHFVRNAMAAIRNGKFLEISVQPGWRKERLLEELPSLLTDEIVGNTKERRKSVVNMYLLMRVLTVIFYAKTGSYTVGYRNSESLVVTLAPPLSEEG